jgi:NAD(P)-dependent dehydrogenase (short-subunit alcohol dehydrogenase family)
LTSGDDSSPPDLPSIIKEVRDLSRSCEVVYCDMRDFDGLENRVVEEAVEKMSGRKIDILVHCAGIQRRNRIEEFKLEDWDEVRDEIFGNQLERLLMRLLRLLTSSE